MNDDMNDQYADSDFLAKRDLTVSDFRKSEKETKHKIIEKMLALRHNMKYNKHLLSVYIRAKGLFDTMIEEHRSQLYYLDEIYRHINKLIRENLSTVSKKGSGMMSELVKDKKRIGTLLKKMRNSYDKLMDIDTVIGVTIDKMNEITFMEDDEAGDEEIDESEHEDQNHGSASEEEEDSASEDEEEEEEEDSASEEEDSASEEEEEDDDTDDKNNNRSNKDEVILLY
jgi:cobalamin biosynthesis protein CobT